MSVGDAVPGAVAASPMLERVACALAATDLRVTAAPVVEQVTPQHMVQARAVLLALREPTPKMLEAFDRTPRSHVEDGPDMPEGWRAMIDAALGEEA